MSQFKVAGVSVGKSGAKVRFANDLTRVKILAKTGQTDIELIELPEAMTKPAVVTYLKTTNLMDNPVYRTAIEEADEKYNGAPAAKVAKASLLKTGTAKPVKAEKKVSAKKTVPVTA